LNPDRLGSSTWPTRKATSKPSSISSTRRLVSTTSIRTSGHLLAYSITSSLRNASPKTGSAVTRSVPRGTSCASDTARFASSATRTISAQRSA
jgi:hypothetical protein